MIWSLSLGHVRRQARFAEQSPPGSGTSLLVKQEALIAWTSLYIAVGIMALIGTALSTIVTLNEWRTGRWAPACTSTLDKALLLPKLWLRWQANYLTGTPVILAISLYYASSIGFSVFWDI
jgi:hypothetical protein